MNAKKHGSLWNPFTVKQCMLVFAGSAISSKMLCIFIALLTILSKTLLGTLLFFKFMLELAIFKSVIQFFFVEILLSHLPQGNATIWLLSQTFSGCCTEDQERM